MKIIYLHQYFTTPSMSGGTRSYEMARRMVAAGHEVHMVTSARNETKGSRQWFKTLEEGVHVHWFPVSYSNHMTYAQRIRAFVVFALAARGKAIALKGDVILATSTPLTIGIPAVLAARKNKVPMVFEVRDLWPEIPIAMGVLKSQVMRYAARKLELWTYQNSTAVVALSCGMKDGVVSTGYPADRIAVIPNSSDNEEFQYDALAAHAFRAQRFWLGNRPLMVYTGTFGKVNGVEYMVALAQELSRRDSDIRILLVGDGQERQAVIDLAKAAMVYERNLFFEPKISKREIPALLSAATIAASVVIDLPELRANSANKFFDALASGTPVFLNHGGWMHDLIRAKNCGLAMWQVEIESVAAELELKLHDSDWLKNAGDAARALAEEAFDRDELTKQMLEVLVTAVAGKPEAAAAIAPGRYE